MLYNLKIVAQKDTLHFKYKASFGINALPNKYFPHGFSNYYNQVPYGYHFGVTRMYNRLGISLSCDANRYNLFKRSRLDREKEFTFSLSPSIFFSLLKDKNRWILGLSIEVFGDFSSVLYKLDGHYDYKKLGVYGGCGLEFGRKFGERWECIIGLDDAWGYFNMKSGDGQLLSDGYDSRSFHEPLLGARYNFNRIAFRKKQK